MTSKHKNGLSSFSGTTLRRKELISIESMNYITCRHKPGKRGYYVFGATFAQKS